MTLTFSEFLTDMLESLPFLITSLLTIAVILVNGWTDAPNAIATCVSTRALTPEGAIIMAAIMNFLGCYVFTLINSSVVTTISNMVDFGNDSKSALIALCAALVGIVVWATAAWYFGIPTSETHALIAGLSGAAIALGGASGINLDTWMLNIYGLVLSTILGFGLGWLISKITVLIASQFERKQTTRFFKMAQIAGAASMAFMHGAQDGQSFMAIFMLGMFIARGSTVNSFVIPVWMMILCSIVMALGTSIGGYRIIKQVGMNMARLETYQGFAADTAATLCLFVSSLLGMSVSTTQTKTTAIMGVGAAKRMRSVDWTIVKEMVFTWICTFPGCGLVGFLMAKLFIVIFK
ncbi:MAG: inorganic phosphate transporter [Eubacteriaceae bacterium]|nr:inorganic phosphate transporter [Eubacteriaceae bacterium]